MELQFKFPDGSLPRDHYNVNGVNPVGRSNNKAWAHTPGMQRHTIARDDGLVVGKMPVGARLGVGAIKLEPNAATTSGDSKEETKKARASPFMPRSKLSRKVQRHILALLYKLLFAPIDLAVQNTQTHCCFFNFNYM